ncbi:MAG: cytochrome P450 [Pirellulales bacterium]|nr:cytochrome P450 [Pirellulales bacterium]
MTGEHTPDWDPRAEDVLRDQRAAYDAMRETCPVAYSRLLEWSIFRHKDVLRVLRDHETFSNVVSTHLSAPNGMDPPEHTVYRRVIEPYFAPDKMQAFAPGCRVIAAELVERGLAGAEIECMSALARPFAVRVQCAFLGWPATLEEPLIEWTQRNREATRAQDREALAQLARQFEGVIDDQLERRQQSQAGPHEDVTAALMYERVWDRPLSNEEIASILRNWTVGEIGTIASSIGILIHFVSTEPKLQARLRAEPALLPRAIDEILRLDGPLIANRRIAKRSVVLGGRQIAAGERLSLMWIAANRDAAVFDSPYEFRWDRDPAKNLLYGAGIHVCPGAPLARLELQIFLEELLGRAAELRIDYDRPAIRGRYPGAGYEQLYIGLPERT